MAKTKRVLQRTRVISGPPKGSIKFPIRETFLIKIEFIGSNSFLNVLPFILLTLTWIFQPTIQLIASTPFHHNAQTTGEMMIELSEENINDHPTPVKSTKALIDLAGSAKDGNGTPLDGQVATLYDGTIEVASDVIENGEYLIKNILLTGTTLLTDNEFWVNQNFPNPFGASTKIEYSLDQNERVKIDLFDIQGKHVKTIEDAMKGAGEHSITVDANELSDGIYIYALKAGDKAITKKMIHLSGGPEPSGDGPEPNFKSVKSSYNLIISGENFITKDTILELYGSGLITVPPLTVLELPLITGFVYNLDTKWDENGDRLTPIGIPNMIAYLGSNPDIQTTTDIDGQFYLRLPEIPTDLDSIFVVGSSPSDTAYYFWKKPELEITHDTNYITAFNDTTGIPLFTRMWDSISPWMDGISLLDYIIQATNIDEKLIGWGQWEHTTSRYKDEDMQHEIYGNGIRVFMNRDIAPNEWYADSTWSGLKAGEIGRFNFVEVSDIEDALVVMTYDHYMVGQTIRHEEMDEMGIYFTQNPPQEIRIRGPPGGSIIGPLNVLYVVAHEKYHIGFAGGEHSPFIQDNFYGYPSQRINAGMPIEGSERERRSVETIYDLERNPKFFHYSSDNALF